MSKIFIDKTILSSAFPGFGYINTLSGSIFVSGSVPPGGRDYIAQFTVPSNSFVIAFYTNQNGNDNPKGKYRVGNLPNAAVDGVGNNVYMLGSQSGTTYTVKINVDNAGGSAQTVPTQTVPLQVYLFRSPFA